MYTMHPINKPIEIESFVAAYDFIHPENFYFAGEMHNFWEVVFVKSGKAIATGDERIYNLSEGQLLFHKPMEFHRIWSAEGSSPHLNILSFSAAGKGMNSLKERCFSLTEGERTAFCTLFNSFDLAQKMFEQCGKESGEYRVVSAKAAARLEIFLLGFIGKQALSNEPVSADEQSFRRIVEVMNEHCGENLSVEQLAEYCLMSRSNMKRIFAKYSDIGLAKYFLGLKMRRAMKLLDGGFSASDTAALLGFNEVSYFHTVFKRETGLTPMQYKKSRHA